MAVTFLGLCWFLTTQPPLISLPPCLLRNQVSSDVYGWNAQLLKALAGKTNGQSSDRKTIFLMPFCSRRTTSVRRLCADTGGQAAGIFWKQADAPCLHRQASFGEVEEGNAWKKQKDYKDEKQQSCKLIQHLHVILQLSAALRLSICCCFFSWWW